MSLPLTKLQINYKIRIKMLKKIQKNELKLNWNKLINLSKNLKLTHKI